MEYSPAHLLPRRDFQKGAGLVTVLEPKVLPGEKLEQLTGFSQAHRSDQRGAAPLK